MTVKDKICGGRAEFTVRNGTAWCLAKQALTQILDVSDVAVYFIMSDKKGDDHWKKRV